MPIRRTGVLSVVFTRRCPHCKEEFQRNTGWGTATGEICAGCKQTGQTIEDLAAMRPVNQHWR
jgi:hypothetical protein